MRMARRSVLQVRMEPPVRMETMVLRASLVPLVHRVRMERQVRMAQLVLPARTV